MKIKECKVGMDVASRDNPRYTYRITKVNVATVSTITTNDGPGGGIRHDGVLPGCLYPLVPDAGEESADDKR